MLSALNISALILGYIVLAAIVFLGAVALLDPIENALEKYVSDYAAMRFSLWREKVWGGISEDRKEALKGGAKIMDRQDIVELIEKVA
jgi:hypothetical protein